MIGPDDSIPRREAHRRGRGRASLGSAMAAIVLVAPIVSGLAGGIAACGTSAAARRSAERQLPGPEEVEVSIHATEARAVDLERSSRLRDALEARREALEGARDHPRLAAMLLVRAGRNREAAGDVQAAVLAYEAALKALARDPALHVGQVVDRLLADPEGGQKRPIRSALPAPSDLFVPSHPPELAAAAAEGALAVKVLVHVGNAYARMPQDAPALGRYLEALARVETGAEPELRANVLANAAEMQRRLGRREEARGSLESAWASLPTQASRIEHRRLLMVRGALERDAALPLVAVRTYGEAADLYSAAKDRRGEGMARAAQGLIFLQQGMAAEARTAYQAALELSAQRAGGGPADDELVWQAAMGLGDARRRLGDLDGAIEALRLAGDRIDAWRERLATDEGKVAFVDLARRAGDALVEAYLERARPERGHCANPDACADALAAIERSRGRALEDLMACSLIGLERDPGEPLTCAGVLRRYGGVEMASSVPCAMVPENLRESPVQMATGLRSAPRAGGGPRPRASAGPGPAPRALTRLVFHVLDDRTAVMVAGVDGSVRGHVAPVGRAALAARVAALRAALGVDDRSRRGVAFLSGTGGGPVLADSPGRLLAELHRDLVAPVETALPRAGEVVVVEPHESLWLVPFAALRRADGSWLGDHWPLLAAPSGEVLDEVRRRPRGPARPRADLSALAVGNPLAHPLGMAARGLAFRFDPLPFAEEEARAIGALFRGPGSRLLLSGRADLDAVLWNIERQDVIHLATHGVALSDDPLDSFLVLTPSPVCRDTLTARQVTLLSLRADLVVLSACQTGLGLVTADGMIGLARAFLSAGARTVVVSQWSVSDVATSTLMQAYYRAYLGGADKATALRAAILETRARFPMERDWAPFVVFGAED